MYQIIETTEEGKIKILEENIKSLHGFTGAYFLKKEYQMACSSWSKISIIEVQQ